MPKSHSTHRARDQSIIDGFKAVPDDVFNSLGISRQELSNAQDGLVGYIVLPTDRQYDHDRMLSNPVFNQYPSMIVFCESETDVAVALELAHKSPMPFTVRSGGHCTAGFSQGSGVLIDVSGLDDVVIDHRNMSVVVGAGCSFRKFNAALAPYNLHVPGGECDGVCIGGYVQGGGIGFTSATFGMNCDNVIEMRVLLADGSVVLASASQNTDLWWAMRGGTGGNFGVLLSVTYKLYTLDSCTGWALAWPMTTPEDRKNCAKVMALLDEKYIVNSPYGENLTLQVLWVWQNYLDPNGPKYEPMIPVFMVRGLWVGDPAEAAKSMETLQATTGCVTQFIKTGSYEDVLDWLLNKPQEQPVIDEAKGMPFEDKSSRYIAKPVDTKDWTHILDRFVLDSPNMLTYGYLEVYTGAINSYPIWESAFIHRDVLYDVVMDVFWYTPDEREASETFMWNWNKTIEKHWNGHVYQNYASVQVPDYAENYWGFAVPLLSWVKQKYDPETRFTFAQQIPQPPQYDDDAEPSSQDYPDVVKAWKQPIDYLHGHKAIMAKTSDGAI